MYADLGPGHAKGHVGQDLLASVFKAGARVGGRQFSLADQNALVWIFEHQEVTGETGRAEDAAPGQWYYQGVVASVLRDVQLAVRSWRKTPLVSAVAVLTLALGIGANSAMFSMVNSVLLRPLPFERPGRLVLIGESSRQRNIIHEWVPAANFLDYKAQSHSFSGIAAAMLWAFVYNQDRVAVRVFSGQVASTYFTVLGIRPVLGRTFLPEEDRPGVDDVVIISDAFWKRALGGDPLICGKTIRINGRPNRVVGVVPVDAGLPVLAADLWKPLGWDNRAASNRVDRDYVVVGRLRDGVSLKSAESELVAISQRMAEKYPSTNTDWQADLQPLTEGIFGDARGQLALLLAVAALVLLIACVNLASLFAARISARQREVATRLALGATRWRLVRQLLVESVLLALTGGAVGAWLAWGVLPRVVALLPQFFPRGGQIAMGGLGLLFTLALSAAAGVAFGAMPALREARRDIHSTLQDSARGASRGAGRGRFLEGLVVAQIALSMVLVAGAGLLVRSFLALRRADAGFRAEHVLIVNGLVLPANKYDTRPKRQEFFHRLLERARALPGIEAAGATDTLPLMNEFTSRGFRMAGQAQTERGKERGAVMTIATPGYFEAMGIPLRRGRRFTEGDRESSRRVALINETLARLYYANRDPVGEVIYFPGQAMPVEIVGVVGSSRQESLYQAPRPEIFTPLRQTDTRAIYVVARTLGNPEAAGELVQREVAVIDPEQPAGHRTAERQVFNSLAAPRLIASVLGLFAILALVLALVGIYGVTWYIVGQRTREIGIRMALGARPGAVAGMVLRRTALLALVGIVAGAAAGLALARLIGQFLFGVGAADPLTYANAALLLLAAAVGASVAPAWTAARVDPLVAMRQE